VANHQSCWDKGWVIGPLTRCDASALQRVTFNHMSLILNGGLCPDLF
jgi:hypothetical protein